MVITWKNIRLARSVAGNNDFPNPDVGQWLVDEAIQFWAG